MKPPARFVTDTTLPPRLKQHVNSIARARFPYDRERGLIALQGALGQLAASDVAHAATPNHATIGGSSAGSSLVAGATVKLVLITAVGLTVWGVSREWPPAHARRIPTAQSIAAVATGASDAPISPSLPADGNAEPSQRPNSTLLAPVRPAVANAARLAQTTESSRARREIAQLNQIKRTLLADPATALRLARDSNREFPRGLLREEREAMIVLALWQLDDVAAARAGAEQFLSHYPHSSFRTRLQRYVSP